MCVCVCPAYVPQASSTYVHVWPWNCFDVMIMLHTGGFSATLSFLFTITPSFVPLSTSHFLSFLFTETSHSLIEESACTSPSLSSSHWLWYQPVYMCFLLVFPFICQLLSLHTSFALSLNVTPPLCHESAVSLFPPAANSINKMPSPQLSFPITAPLSVRTNVVPHARWRFFFVLDVELKWTCSLCDKTCSSSSKKREII